jgi:Putative Actinobacterial Holin-X, holin superfamily III
MALAYDPRSIPQLFTDIVNQLTNLLRKESELARTEVSEKVSQATLGLAMVVFGAVLLIPALVVLLEAGVAALDRTGFAPYWSALIVGGGALLLGLIVMMIGLGRLKAERLMPRKTIEQLQQDASTVKQQMRNDHGRTHQRAA